MQNIITLSTPIEISIPSLHPKGETRNVALKSLRVNFTVDSKRQLILANIVELRRPFALYSLLEFADHAGDSNEQHLARLTTLMGENKKSFLQSIANQTGEIKALAVPPQIQAAYDAAVAAFETLSLGKQALWEPVRRAVAKAILKGDMVTAAEILTTLPALYEEAEEDRQIFLALFQQ
jgi:hypothetical protein